jgi:hypothetical protein
MSDLFAQTNWNDVLSGVITFNLGWWAAIGWETLRRRCSAKPNAPQSRPAESRPDTP